MEIKIKQDEMELSLKPLIDEMFRNKKYVPTSTWIVHNTLSLIIKEEYQQKENPSNTIENFFLAESSVLLLAAQNISTLGRSRLRSNKCNRSRKRAREPQRNHFSSSGKRKN